MSMILLLIGNVWGFTLFRGNLSLADKNSSANVRKQLSPFQIAIDHILPKDNFTCVVGRALLTNSNDINLPKRTIKIYGASDNATSIHYMFNLVGFYETNATTMCRYIEKMLNNNSIYNPNDYYKMHSLISEQFSRSFQKIEVFSILFKNESYLSNANKYFDYNKGISGFVLWRNHNITFTANLFKHDMFVSEGKIYGVITALSLVWNYFAWKSIIDRFCSNSNIQLLSIHSFIMHVCFEFSYTLFVFDFSMQSVYLTKLFTFLYISMISLFFIYQINEVGIILKSKITAMETNDALAYFIKFFIEISVLISFSCVLAGSIFDNPIIGSAILYSFFIPQIIHSAITPGRKHGDEFFTITLSIIRLIPVWYFCLYKRNIMEKYSAVLAIVVTIYVALQAFVIVLQNIYGGSFFLPRKMRPTLFNYFEGELPENCVCAICMSHVDETDSHMVTPCSHAFHTQCLSRWMDEQLICPICRAPIPPFDGYSHEV